MRTFLKIIRQHIIWRHQLLKLAKADIIKTYSGAALGWAWAIIKPAVTIFVFWFAFDIGLHLGEGAGYNEYPFILWFMAGMMPWFFMEEMFIQGANSLRVYNYLVTKMRFPIATIPTFVALSKLLVHLALMGITVLFFLCYGFAPDRYLLQLPIYMACMLLFFISWAQFASLLTCMSKDFFNLVGAMVQALFWLSGILYNVHTMNVPDWLKVILLFNPITFIANGYRNIFIYKVWIWEEPAVFGYFLIMLVLMTGFALWAYRKLYREIPDVL
ncbi:MAG: ABC transporter permease [Clostridiales Family XIII bacterium]|jgi:teichoic acid transport system permease protein|nr:ABC transporter permease [Clostridiales Family XIII bacterium]